LLPQLLEVIEDIVVPWHREIKEKRDLLREDPFVGFIAMAVVGAICYFFFRDSPSWIGFFLLYGGMVMFILGSIAALAVGWFGWGLFRYAAWPTAFVVIIIYGCFDTYTITKTFDPIRISRYRIEENAFRSVTQTDTFKRFTGRPLYRVIDTSDEVQSKTFTRTISEGPLNPAGRKEGRWTAYSLVPKRSLEIATWYRDDKVITEAEWRNTDEKK
jgi:hypothetical protein